MAEIGRKGAKATTKKLRAEGLRKDELPPLDSPAAAGKWLEIVGRAVATGRLAYRDADAVTRAVRAWLDAERDRVAAEDVAELRSQLEEVRTSLKEGRRLEILE